MTKCNLSEYRTDGCSNCDRLCPHYIALHGLDGTGGRTSYAKIPSEYRHITLNNSPARESQADTYRKLSVYVKTFKRHLSGGERTKSLYLWSKSPGTGKTTTASALLNTWIANEYLYDITRGKQPRQSTAYFLDVNELQTQYNLATMTKDSDKLHEVGRIIALASKASFAVIDDIGVRDASEAFRAYVHSVINYRTSNGLPTVYTSNLPIEDMKYVFDDRLYDRINDQCAAFHFDGTSKRGIR